MTRDEKVHVMNLSVMFTILMNKNEYDTNEVEKKYLNKLFTKQDNFSPKVTKNESICI